jgi:hypothetical protein
LITCFEDSVSNSNALKLVSGKTIALIPRIDPDFKKCLLEKKPIIQSYKMEICKLNL